MKPEEKKPKFSIYSFLCKEVLIPCSILIFCTMIYTLVSAFIAVYAQERGVANIGVFFTVYALTLLFVRPAMGRIVDEKGAHHFVIPCCISLMISMGLIGLARSLPVFIAAALFLAFGYGLMQPLIQSLSMKLVPPEKRGIASNTVFACMDFGSGFGAMLAGPLRSVRIFGNVFCRRFHDADCHRHPAGVPQQVYCGITNFFVRYTGQFR